MHSLTLNADRWSAANSLSRTAYARRAQLHLQHISTTPHDALRRAQPLWYAHPALKAPPNTDSVVTLDFITPSFVSSAWPTKAADPTRAGRCGPGVRPSCLRATRAPDSTSARLDRAVRIHNLIDRGCAVLQRDGRATDCSSQRPCGKRATAECLRHSSDNH